MPQLARAGWASVFLAGDRVVAAASAPVWFPAVQSFGNVAWSALGGVTQVLTRPTPICTDYQSIARICSEPQRSAADLGALRHGGLVRFFFTHPQRHFVSSIS